MARQQIKLNQQSDAGDLATLDNVAPDLVNRSMHTVIYDFGSGTGTREITGFDFTPQYMQVLLLIGIATIDIGADGFAGTNGSSIVQAGVTRHSTDATANRRSQSSESQCFYARYNNADRLLATVTSFEYGKVTINVTNNANNDSYYRWLVRIGR